MAYNAQVGRGFPMIDRGLQFSEPIPVGRGFPDPGVPGSGYTNFQPYDTTPMQNVDQYAGNPYTGNQSYQPPAPNPQDYWNEASSGYSQMPQYSNEGYQPYDVTANYQPQYIEGSDWENANTYAPWSGANSPGGYESTSWELANQPGYTAYGGRGNVGMYDNTDREGAMISGAGTGLVGAGADTALTSAALGGPMGLGAMLGPMAPLGFLAGAGTGALYSAITGRRKKRPNYEFESPSYQGHMFTPQEGFPEYYRPSQETIGNQTQQDIYSQQPYQQEVQQTPTQQTYDYNYTGGGQQNYVGQQNQDYGSLYNNTNPLYQTFTL